jgi:signal transduction histidine kinase
MSISSTLLEINSGKPTMSVSDNYVTRILLVDDTPVNLKVLSEAVRDHGWTTLIATDGESAIEQAEYARPSLILLDVMMPGIDGFETCRRLKQNPATANIPIIFMTALSDSVNKVRGLELGAVDYVTKPFQQEEVLARVKLHLKLHLLSQDLEQQNHTLEQRVLERTSDLEQSLQQMQEMQLQLIQSEKLSSLGQLMAGLAHEINNPVNYLTGNLDYAKKYVGDVIEHLDLYRQQQDSETIEAHAQRIDLDFLLRDLPAMVSSMNIGIQRIEEISVGLRTFARSDQDEKIRCDLHQGLDSAILILRHRLKANQFRPEIKIVKSYGGLPEIDCFLGQLNQVFMNLLANAIDALDESNLGRDFAEISERPNCITVTTWAEETSVYISVRDNGIGMDEAVRSKIFDYLYTTKPVGKGTGIGLALVSQIVRDAHGGTLEVRSQLGSGAEFIIGLPMR